MQKGSPPIYPNSNRGASAEQAVSRLAPQKCTPSEPPATHSRAPPPPALYQLHQCPHPAFKPPLQYTRHALPFKVCWGGAACMGRRGGKKRDKKWKIWWRCMRAWWGWRSGKVEEMGWWLGSIGLTGEVLRSVGGLTGCCAPELAVGVWRSAGRAGPLWTLESVRRLWDSVLRAGDGGW